MVNLGRNVENPAIYTRNTLFLRHFSVSSTYLCKGMTGMFLFFLYRLSARIWSVPISSGGLNKFLKS